MVLYNKLLNYQLSVTNAVLHYHRHKHQQLLIHKSSIVNSDLHDLVPSAASEECVAKINSQHPREKWGGGNDFKRMQKNKLRIPASHQHHQVTRNCCSAEHKLTYITKYKVQYANAYHLPKYPINDNQYMITPQSSDREPVSLLAVT